MTFVVPYIKRERRKWGLTQQDVARLIGVATRSHISALERGRVCPSAEVLVALQFLFGMAANDLFPQLYRRTQRKVLRNAAVILEAIKTNPTLRTQRVKLLLDQFSEVRL